MVKEYQFYHSSKQRENNAGPKKVIFLVNYRSKKMAKSRSDSKKDVKQKGLLTGEIRGIRSEIHLLTK